MYGYVYITTNLLNNKIYIGQHVASVFEPERYIGSGLYFLRAVKKYGKQNFKNELLCECQSQEELDKQEMYYIDTYQSTNPDIGYNLSKGSSKNNVDTITITNDQSERHVLPDYLEYYEKLGFHLGRNMNRYVNGMIGKQQSDHQKAMAAKACSYKRTDAQKANFSAAKKIPNKFCCLRTPDNKSTIRCLLKNKAHYLALGYIECKTNK